MAVRFVAVNMAVIEVLAVIAGLWASASAIALVALAGIYGAERTGRAPGDGPPVAAMSPIVITERDRERPSEPALRLETA